MHFVVKFVLQLLSNSLPLVPKPMPVKLSHLLHTQRINLSYANVHTARLLCEYSD